MAEADQQGDTAAAIPGYAPLPPIAAAKAGLAGGETPLRWTTMLVWLMRTMALVWIAKGLFSWSVILGANPRIADFATMDGVLEATFIFFAVADLIAAVGLWLASPWGGVLWLVCAICEAATPLISVRASFVSAIGVGINAALVALYFVLSWMAARERA